MRQNPGILFLSDGLGGSGSLPGKADTNAITLVFNENERYLYQAQQALWELRKSCSWICISARGDGALVALALAAQLPVDRLALSDFSVFSSRRLPAELARLRSYVRRNLALVVSQLLLSGVEMGEVRRLARCLGSREICLLDKLDPEEFTAPWDRLGEKNLLIPGKCV